ncbi:hypothetical protein NIES4102_11310 [Chondrocystis sp. NIES-4102]|nr:hypothetical protein NIES4102_11310 [Chondrocystis sp. NIES-4102]
MLTYQEQPLELKPIAAEELKKQERMRDVTLLLQQMVEREEVALKLIIDCLIDVGAINYANYKLNNPTLNKMMKILVGYVKPVARPIALRWVKKNLPNLVSAWLESQVSFKPVPINDKEAITGELETVPVSQADQPIK